MESINSHQDLSQSGDQKGSKKSKLFFFFFFSLFITLIALFLWLFFRQKSVGDISVVEREELSVENEKTRKTVYDGEYIIFAYPSDFKEKPSENPLKNPILERVYLSRGTVDGKKIAVLVQEVDYKLEEYSGYRMRELDSGTYTKEKKTINGLDITFFRKDIVVYEVAAFIAKNGKVVSFALSSPVQKEGLYEELVSILETFRWED